MKNRNVVLLKVWLSVLALALATGCATAPPPLWEEATGYGVMPWYRDPGDAHVRARAAAQREANEKLFRSLLDDKIGDDTTIEQLALINQAFRSRLYGAVAGAKFEELPDQPNGIVAVKVRIDKNKLYRIARKYLRREPVIAVPLKVEQGRPAPDRAGKPGAERPPSESAVLAPKEPRESVAPAPPTPTP